MGLPFLSSMSGYIQTGLYGVITAAGLTLWTGTNSGVPQGGADGPFPYLLVTLPDGCIQHRFHEVCQALCRQEVPAGKLG